MNKVTSENILNYVYLNLITTIVKFIIVIFTLKICWNWWIAPIFNFSETILIHCCLMVLLYEILGAYFILEELEYSQNSKIVSKLTKSNFFKICYQVGIFIFIALALYFGPNYSITESVSITCVFVIIITSFYKYNKKEFFINLMSLLKNNQTSYVLYLNKSFLNKILKTILLQIMIGSILLLIAYLISLIINY